MRFCHARSVQHLTLSLSLWERARQNGVRSHGERAELMGDSPQFDTPSIFLPCAAAPPPEIA